jgi:hypothetical protein
MFMHHATELFMAPPYARGPGCAAACPSEVPDIAPRLQSPQQQIMLIIQNRIKNTWSDRGLRDRRSTDRRREVAEIGRSKVPMDGSPGIGWVIDGQKWKRNESINHSLGKAHPSPRSIEPRPTAHRKRERWPMGGRPSSAVAPLINSPRRWLDGWSDGRAERCLRGRGFSNGTGNYRSSSDR